VLGFDEKGTGLKFPRSGEKYGKFGGRRIHWRPFFQSKLGIGTPHVSVSALSLRTYGDEMTGPVSVTAPSVIFHRQCLVYAASALVPCKSAPVLRTAAGQRIAVYSAPPATLFTAVMKRRNCRPR